MHSGSYTYRLWLSALDWNVAVYKGLLLELPSGHVIVLTVYNYTNSSLAIVQLCTSSNFSCCKFMAKASYF